MCVNFVRTRRYTVDDGAARIGKRFPWHSSWRRFGGKWWLGRIPGKRNDKRDIVGYVGEAELMTEFEPPWVTGITVTMELKERKGDECAWRLREN